MIVPAGAPHTRGRLASVWRIQRTHHAAKQALAKAEAAMRSVHTGLACDVSTLPPSPAPVVAPRPPRSAPEPPTEHTNFDTREFFRNLHVDQIPLFTIAITLLLTGWALAYVLMAVVDPATSRSVVAAVTSSKAAERAPAKGPAVKQAAASKATSPTADSARPEDVAVVIYGGSPYGASFSAISPKDRKCLAEAIYYEARGEPVAGQLAVAQVVLNRILAGSWPRTVCEVTSQGIEAGEKCQFSYACFKQRLGAPSGDAWHNAQALAEDVLEGGAWLEEMLIATHFHRVDLKPVWRTGMTEIGRYGRHVFYTSPAEIRRPLAK